MESCVYKGWAEPWFDNPIKPDWMVCKLTAAGYAVLGQRLRRTLEAGSAVQRRRANIVNDNLRLSVRHGRDGPKSTRSGPIGVSEDGQDDLRLACGSTRWRANRWRLGSARPVASSAPQTGGDANLEREVLGLFRSRCPADLARSRSRRTPRRAGRSAHAMVGSARAVGAEGVARFAAAIERGNTDDDRPRSRWPLPTRAGSSTLIWPNSAAPSGRTGSP